MSFLLSCLRIIFYCANIWFIFARFVAPSLNQFGDLFVYNASSKKFDTTSKQSFLSVSKMFAPDTTIVNVMVFYGSGGHSFEMTELFRPILESFSADIARVYVVSEGDELSVRKISATEDLFLGDRDRESDGSGGGSFSLDYNSVLFKLPRARNVMQSWFTTPFTVLRTLLVALIRFYDLFQSNRLPDLYLANGPGTCIILCIPILLLRVSIH